LYDRSIYNSCLNVFVTYSIKEDRQEYGAFLSFNGNNLTYNLPILISLLISGGMLIPENIPNIVCANKLNISGKEWAKIGVPMGFIFLVIYFVILFLPT